MLKMSMIKQIQLILFILISVTSFADIKKSVVIIKPELHSEISKAYIDKSEKLKKNGQKKLSDTYQSFTEGGFGSGFVISDDNGNYYFLTNRHVVEFSESITAVIEKDDGSNVELNNLELFYIDREMDLALIKFDAKEDLIALNISTMELEDGAKVWAAGFPGLLGEPGWQFSMGNITNKKAKLNNVTVGNLDYLIQHSATIDPGNSGGPLLIEDETQISGYSVIGINTWSISNRNSTFFSIPSKTIIEFLNRAFNNKAITLEESVDLFLNEFTKEDPNQEIMTSFISSDLIGNKGLDSFDIVLDASSVSLRNRWRDSFYNNSSSRTIRGAIYERIVDEYHSDDLSKIIQIGQANNKTLETKVKLSLGNQKVITYWGLHYGLWQLNDLKFNNDSIITSDNNEKKKGEISSAFMNFALPGFTQYQRKDMNALYYSALALGGVLYTAMGISNAIDPSSDNINSLATPELLISTGLLFYIGSGLISFIHEVAFN